MDIIGHCVLTVEELVASSQGMKSGATAVAMGGVCFCVFSALFGLEGGACGLVRFTCDLHEVATCVHKQKHYFGQHTLPSVKFRLPIPKVRQMRPQNFDEAPHGAIVSAADRLYIDLKLPQSH